MSSPDQNTFEDIVQALFYDLQVSRWVEVISVVFDDVLPVLQRYMMLAGLAIILYDWFLTLSVEVGSFAPPFSLYLIWNSDPLHLASAVDTRQNCLLNRSVLYAPDHSFRCLWFVHSCFFTNCLLTIFYSMEWKSLLDRCKSKLRNNHIPFSLNNRFLRVANSTFWQTVRSLVTYSFSKFPQSQPAYCMVAFFSSLHCGWFH
jgi:hypothetical protein